MEQKLLDLTLEYATAKEYEGAADEIFRTARTPEQIATEYGQVLKQFLAS